MILRGLFVSVFLCVYVDAVAAPSATPLVKMDLGTVEYDLSETRTSQARLGTDGSMSYTRGFTGDGFGTPGEILLSDTVGVVLDISCRGNIRISDGGPYVTINRIQFDIGTANGKPYNASTRCSGKNTIVASHTVTGVPALDTLLVGGRLNTAPQNLTTNTWDSEVGTGRGGRFWVVEQ